MQCPDEGAIADFVARSITAASAAGLEAHLADCDDCRRLTFALATEHEADRPDAEGPIRIGRFEVIGELGGGAMGRVYRALDPELGRHVAVKVRNGRPGLDVEADDRLRREAQALARLSHPNVVAVYETGRHADTTYVAMEYVDGVTLDRWVATPREPRALIELFAGMARGLAAAHAVGLVHRDVKPHNIFISSTGLAKVGDFGLVRLGAASHPGERDAPAALALPLTLSLTGSLVGTPAYMAPEQLRGELATERSDQFSFCVTMFEALSGARPFIGRTVEALLAAIARGPASDKLDAMPARIRGVLVRGLQFDPQRRFSSMAELAAVLSPRSTTARWVAFGAAAGAIVAVALAVTRAVAPDPSERCAVRDEQALRVFSPERSRAIEAAFAAQDTSAVTEGRSVGRMLQDYGARWEAANAGSCRATASGGQSPELRDRQRGCLERRLRQADDLGLVMTRPARGAALTDAARAVEALPDPEACTRAGAALSDRESPLAPLAPVVAELDRSVDRMVNLERAGRAREASEQIEGVVASARAMQFSPLLARALLAQASVYAAVERFGEIEPLLDEAAREAAKAHEDEIVAEAWTRRVNLTATHLGRPAEARRWVPVADAAVLRAGNPPEIRALLHAYHGMLLSEQGEYKQARRQLETALAIRERSQPSGALAIAELHDDLAVVLMRDGRRDEARAHFDTALGVLRRTHGDLHPLVISTLSNLGALLAATEPRQAIAYLGEARTLGEQLLGPDSDIVTNAINNLGNAWHHLEDYATAVKLHRQVLAIERRRFGDAHPKVAFALGNIARSLLELEDYAGAVEANRACVAVLAAALGPRDTMLARARSGLGDSLQWAGDLAGAIAAYQAALVVWEAGEGADGQEATMTRLELGELLAIAGQVPAARVQFERASRTLAGYDARFRRDVIRGLAGIVYCNAVTGRVDRQRLQTLEDALAAEPDLDATAFAAYARARSYATLGDRAKARVLGDASRAAFAKADMAMRRDAVARWLRGLR